MSNNTGKGRKKEKKKQSRKTNPTSNPPLRMTTGSYSRVHGIASKALFVPCVCKQWVDEMERAEMSTETFILHGGHVLGPVSL